MAMAAVRERIAIVSSRVHVEKRRDGFAAHSKMAGAMIRVPAASVSHKVVQAAAGRAHSTLLARIRPAVATEELMIAVGPAAISANFMTPSGVANVSRPPDQRLASAAPASAASGAPTAMKAASTGEPFATALEKNAPTAIAGQIP